jgi:hypothetical protein
MTKLKENKILIKESRIKKKKRDWITYKKEKEEEEVQFVIFRSVERKKKEKKFRKRDSSMTNHLTIDDKYCTS